MEHLVRGTIVFYEIGGKRAGVSPAGKKLPLPNTRGDTSEAEVSLRSYRSMHAEVWFVGN